MKIINSKATFDYAIQERFEAGLNLQGSEVKSIRDGRASLDGSFVKLIGFEAFLVNAHIFPYPFARNEKYDPKRTRKLLLHKREILKLKHKMDAAGLTIVPLSLYNKAHRIKLEIGLAKGKKQYEKRDAKRRKDQKRELDRQFRGKVK